MCTDYIVENAPYIDFTVSVTKEDIVKEVYDAKQRGEFFTDSVSYIEALVVYRKIAAEMLSREAFLMHGALIEYEGRGYLFTAKSGTGKTTHIRLWQQLFGEDKVTIVNGDKPIIRFVDGKVYAYGTPWCGKEGYNVNTCVELCAIAFVERSGDNSIVKISDIEALPRILSQVMITDSANLAIQLELLDKIFEKVPFYLLKCNMELDAAKVAYEGMYSNK
ncbi:MAG: hypothetical protein IJN48_01480 [Clostridia bacterium]|nr:hypothetical protein [Clostridia bacterium]